MEVTFKIATHSDLNTLVELMQEFYQLDSIDLVFDEWIARNALETLLQNSHLGYVWLIQLDNLLIGYVVLTFGYSLEYRGRDSIIDELYIREDYRGQGIGTKTLEFLRETCASLGIQALHLEVGRDNSKAQLFYRRMGFEDHDRYLMTQWISP